MFVRLWPDGHCISITLTSGSHPLLLLLAAASGAKKYQHRDVGETPMNTQHENGFAGDFAFTKLIPTLVELKVPDHRQSGTIAWFWRNAKTWTADTQAEFDIEARIQLAGQLLCSLPAPKPQPLQEPWKPCKHFGGDRECERCQRKELVAGLIYAGAMAKADAMFKEHRAFVRKRINAELLPYTDGEAYHEFDDLKQK